MLPGGGVPLLWCLISLDKPKGSEHSFPTRRSSDLHRLHTIERDVRAVMRRLGLRPQRAHGRSEEHTSELQSLTNLVCRLLLEKKNRLMLIVARDVEC